MRLKIVISLFLLGGILLVACSSLSSAPTSTPTLSWQAEQSTQVAFLYGPNQVSDERFSVAIENIGGDCGGINETIRIKITIQNLTDETITIPEIFKFALNGMDYSDFALILEPVTNDETHAWIKSFDLPRIPTPSGYSELVGSGIFETGVEFFVPPEIIVNDTAGQSRFYPITPGDYYLKLLYVLYEFDANGKLDQSAGRAISNRIELCVK